MNIWAMLLAAGRGTRMTEATAGIPKQFLEWRGMPLYWASTQIFAHCARVRGLIFVFPEERIEVERERLFELGVSELGLPWLVTAGGNERRDSVRYGLHSMQREEAARDCDAILVHDTARPFVSVALVNRVIDALPFCDGVVPGIAVTDTIKETATSTVLQAGLRRVVTTPDRDRLVAVQTPQAFHLKKLVAAHSCADREKWTVTDDASLLERCGYSVLVVEGEVENRKITCPEDLVMLQQTSIPQFLPRTGWGYDVHRFVDPAASSSEKNAHPARPLRLGGVLIPDAPAVLAHSDGDVLLHALMDALLGCTGTGDIGQLFPDSDPNFDGCDSAVLLDHVMQITYEKKLKIVSMDLTIISQIPRIAPHREAIQRNISRLLGMDSRMISIKATTEEGLGFTGEKRGIKAVALVTALVEQ